MQTMTQKAPLPLGKTLIEGKTKVVAEWETDAKKVVLSAHSFFYEVSFLMLKDDSALMCTTIFA